LHGPIKKIIKIWVTKIDPAPPAPWGRFLGYFPKKFEEKKKKKKIAWPLEKNNKNYGKKKKFEPLPPGPLGAIFRFF
jgi:hypothetical protein